MSDRYNAAFINAAYVGPRSPNPPTIGTAIKQPGGASVAFTAPSPQGGTGSITSYRAVSTPGNFTGTGASSPILVSGLTNGQSYTFQVTAINLYGESLPSAASNAVIPDQTGQILYSAGTFTFIVPALTTSVSVVCVGSGGSCGYATQNAGGGGGLRYKNNISVTPGQSIAVSAGNISYFNTPGENSSFGTSGSDAFYFYAGGGGQTAYGGSGTGTTIGAGADGGGNGGTNSGLYMGGGGAGGYSGNGGNAGSNTGGSAGSGGGGGGGYGYYTGNNFEVYCGNGGGVGVLGAGSNGSGSSGSSPTAQEASKNGGGGSGGTTAATVNSGQVAGYYGGGGGGSYVYAANYMFGAPGAVRIVFPATGGPISPRSFPSTNVGDL
jgi:hypothetical protein